ncbi:hypothetical protein MNBD_CHLOROFLEXI01-9 [hydrothermal vent metagenome]|uniref:LVIVD repeat protein n=1 Tax=hydrothermal vent metagenome TaxID=652676 RepID=A0A3B0V7U1_9ZZZZ
MLRKVHLPSIGGILLHAKQNKSQSDLILGNKTNSVNYGDEHCCKPAVNRRLFGILYVITILLVSCSTLSSDLSTVVPKYTMTPSRTEHEPTPLPLTTIVPSQSSVTSIPPSQIPTLTAATTPSPTATPFPTALSFTEKISFELVNQSGGQTESIAIVGDIAYLGMGMRLMIVNIANPTMPELLGQSQVLPSVVHAVLVRENIAYLGVGMSVITLDVSNPYSPILLNEIVLSGSVTHLVLNEKTLVTGSSFSPSNIHENGVGMVTTINVDQPDKLQLLDSVTLPWYINAMAVANKLVYVSNPADDIFYAISISSPISLPDPVAFQGVALTYSLQIRDQTLYIGGGLSDISVWDISIPFEPQKLLEVQAKPDSDFGLGVVKGFVLMENLVYLDVTSYHGQIMGVPALEIAPRSVSVAHEYLVSSRIIAQDGYLFLADGGLKIYDISAPLNITQVGIFAQPEVWDVATIGSVGIFIDGNKQSNNGNNLYIVSLPDLNILGQYVDETHCQQCYSSFSELTITDNTAYVSATDDGLRIISLANLNNPELFDSLDTTNGFGDLRAGSVGVNENIYVANAGYCNGRNLMVVDLHTHQDPQRIANIEVDGCIQQLAINNNILYVGSTFADREGGELYLLNTVDAELNQLGYVTFSEGVVDFQVMGDIVIVATSTEINIISTNDPTDPQIIGEMPIPGGIYEIAVMDDVAFVTTVDGHGNGLLAIDLSDPSILRLVGAFNLPAKGETGLVDKYLLVGNLSMGLVVLHVKR